MMNSIHCYSIVRIASLLSWKQCVRMHSKMSAFASSVEVYMGNHLSISKTGLKMTVPATDARGRSQSAFEAAPPCMNLAGLLRMSDHIPVPGEEIKEATLGSEARRLPRRLPRRVRPTLHARPVYVCASSDNLAGGPALVNCVRLVTHASESGCCDLYCSNFR